MKNKFIALVVVLLLSTLRVQAGEGGGDAKGVNLIDDILAIKYLQSFGKCREELAGNADCMERYEAKIFLDAPSQYHNILDFLGDFHNYLVDAPPPLGLYRKIRSGLTDLPLEETLLLYRILSTHEKSYPPELFSNLNALLTQAILDGLNLPANSGNALRFCDSKGPLQVDDLFLQLGKNSGKRGALKERENWVAKNDPSSPKKLNDLFSDLNGTSIALFKRIQENDLRDVDAFNELKGKLNPNIAQLTSQFNKVANLVATEILEKRDINMRALVMKKWVKLAKLSLGRGNFDLLMAIMAGLNNSSISRLKRTIAKLPAGIKGDLESLNESMSSQFNFKRYKELLQQKMEEGLQVVPFMGLTLNELTFSVEGGADPMIVKGILDRHKEMQNKLAVPMTLQKTKMREVLKSRKLVNDRDLFKKSLDIEPRE